MIHVVNSKDDYDTSVPTVYCGRGSMLGNPFRIGEDGDRDEVCDKYEVLFNTAVTCEPRAPAFDMAITHIINLAKDGDVNLLCFCAPQRCHCETIKKYVETQL